MSLPLELFTPFLTWCDRDILVFALLIQMSVVLKALMKKTQTHTETAHMRHQVQFGLSLVPNLYLPIEEYCVKSAVLRSFQYYTDFIKAMAINTS